MAELGALPAGHRFPPLAFTVSVAEARAYRAAVEDAVSDPDEAPLPPLLLIARALRLLLERTGLPPGTVHGGQEAEFLRPVRPGQPLRLEAALPRAATRQGMRLVTLETTVLAEDGAPVCRGRATLIVPAPGDAGSATGPTTAG